MGFLSVSCAVPSPPPENFVVALDVIVGKYNTTTPAYDISWSRVKLGRSISVERSLCERTDTRVSRGYLSFRLSTQFPGAQFLDWFEVPELFLLCPRCCALDLLATGLVMIYSDAS